MKVRAPEHGQDEFWKTRRVENSTFDKVTAFSEDWLCKLTFGANAMREKGSNSAPSHKSLILLNNADGNLDEAQTGLLDALFSQASPFYPFVPAKSGPDTFAPLDALLTAATDQVLHIQCAAGETRHTTEFVWQYLMTHIEDSTEIFYFHFDQHDIRFNNIHAMLRTWICQLVYQGMRKRSIEIARVVSYMLALQAWTDEDLLMYWSRFHINVLTDVYIIGGLDECNDSRHTLVAFLHNLFLLREARTKIIITTTTGADPRLVQELAALEPREIYTEESLGSDFLAVPTDDQDIQFELSALLRLNPQLTYTTGAVQVVKNALDAYRFDDDLRRIMVRWLSSSKHIQVQELQEHLSRLDDVRKGDCCGLFPLVLCTIPEERRKWARSILAWILSSVRALQTDEVCVISGLVEGGQGVESIQDIVSWFGGLLRVKHNQVLFGHAKIRCWLESCIDEHEPHDWWQYESSSSRQTGILETCMTYHMSRPKQMSLVKDIYSAEDCLPYATQYWPCHYRHVMESGDSQAQLRSKELILSFLRETQIFSSWVKAYVALADPLTRLDPAAVSPLAIVASLGLDEVVQILKEENDDQEDLLVGLIEAAKQGHPKTVRLLKPEVQFRLDDPILERLMFAATSSGNAEVIEDIMTLMPRESADQGPVPSWLSRMLLKACWLNNKNLVGILLDLGADPRTVLEPKEHFPWRVGILELAVQKKAVGVIGRLLERGLSAKREDGIVNTTLPGFLAAWADQETAELILSASGGFDVASKDDDFTALQFCCEWGQPVVASVLIQHSPNYAEYMDPESASPPMACASSYGHIRTLKVLLESGVAGDESQERWSTGSSALAYAVSGERLDMVTLLLARAKENKLPKVDIDLADDRGVTPLMLSIGLEGKDAETIAQLLLDSGANVNAAENDNGSSGRTALHVAASLQSEHMPAIARALVKHKANIDARDCRGKTPLFQSAYFGVPVVSKVLVDAGASLHLSESDDRSWTPLHAAYDQPEIVRILLDAGMDPTVRQEAARTPLYLAAKDGQIDCLRMMLGSEKQEQRCVARSDALWIAVEAEQEDSVRLLLEAGANVNLTNDDGINLVLIALLQISDNVLRTLLEFRPDLEWTDADNNTILHCVRADTSVSSLKLLSHAGARLDVLNKDDNSPLTCAALWRNWEAVNYMASRPGATEVIRISGADGTALHIACRRGPLSTIMQLIRSGADAHAFCKKSMSTPLTQACVHDGLNSAPEKEAIINYLVEDCKVNVKSSSDNSTYPLHLASLACSDAIIRRLIDKGADPQEPDDMGRKPLHLACYNSLEAVAALDVADQDFASRDKFGRLPLHYAVLSGQSKLIRHVLDKTKSLNLGVNVADDDGWTPLLWLSRAATVYTWEDDDRNLHAIEIASMLRSEGADFSVRGNVRRNGSGSNETRTRRQQRWSAGDIAIYHSAQELAEFLDQSVTEKQEKSGRIVRKRGEQGPSSKFCDGCYLVSYSGKYITHGRTHTDLLAQSHNVVFSRIFLVSGILASPVPVSHFASSAMDSSTLSMSLASSFQKAEK